MKKNYESPIAENLLLKVTDVITGSITVGGEGGSEVVDWNTGSRVV